METSIWVEVEFAQLVVAFLCGGGLWAWAKAREDKRKTPYDMFRDLLTGRFMMSDHLPLVVEIKRQT